MTKFQQMDVKNGKLVPVKTMEINLSKVKSSDPLAYAYGKFQAESGSPMSKAQRGDKLAPEYIRGYKEAKKQLKKILGM